MTYEYEITQEHIDLMRSIAAKDQLVLLQLRDIADGQQIPDACSCGWASAITTFHDSWSGTWCLHCTAAEMANVNNADRSQL